VKALLLTGTGGLEHLELGELPRPLLSSPADVRVRLRAAALNRLDLWVAGGIPGIRYDFPHLPGSDGAGVVEEVGPGGSPFQVGDRVLINPGISCGECDWCAAGEQPLCQSFGILGEHRPGTLAEEIVVPGRNLAPIPAGWSWAEAAALPLATITAWRMLTRRAALGPGETVLIWGIGGGVALAALRIARLLGARVIVTSGSAEKLARAGELGAELGINHATEDVPGVVREYTDRRGVDVVVDSVGEKTWDRSLRCLARRGRLVVCGATSGPMVTTDLRRLFWYQWSLLGSTMGSDAEFRAMVAEATAGRLRPEIDRVYPFADAIAAFRRLESGAQFGKVVVEMPV
jgi:NADPH:quinone reductase-like Zn-dependent oxidoreductase